MPVDNRNKKNKVIGDYSELTGMQKIAVLVMSVGLKSSATMMKTMSKKEVEDITLEIARLKGVRGEIVDAVLEEFYNLMQVKSQMVNGGVEYAQELLEQMGDTADKDNILKRLKSHSGSTVFEEFQESKISHIANFIQNEHPQVAALIFSQLNIERSAEILGLLEPKMQTEIIYRLASMDKISSEVIEEIEEVIKEHMGGMDTMGDRVKSGTNIVAQILNGAEITVERHVLEEITNRDYQMASDIKEQMFLFEDILHFDDRTVQLIINEMEKADLVMGLKGVNDDLSNKFLRNMSNRAADMLREDMEALGPVPLKDVKEAQQRIIKKIKELEEEGQITTRKMDEEEVVE
ncbi:flagellar motor switch protein FliG [Gracilimonas mengyeensis]|uniref:Flagellar motor switch protein FliG n=1 Tax=Gracilimonas mengyeensis TaxID=1302730 RepID=A0A521ECT6_9BACT|nr:flagellar motor switch protein FliG [Gracilimonas mengyeensis]SMO81719.1 flagellar motor switch protein FliG [Gracilimonas mengyeensis]